MKIKKNVYTVRFFGPERYLVMKVFDREMRKSYNVYGGRLVKDTKDYSEMTFKIHEDYRSSSFHDINDYIGSNSRNFCRYDSTDWRIVSVEEIISEVKVID